MHSWPGPIVAPHWLVYTRLDKTSILIWKTMMIAEMSFRKLDAPELVAKVINGTQYEDGKEIQEDRDAA